MTPEKQTLKLGGQSSIAKKVFQFIPIQEAWTHQQIASEMVRVTGAHTDHRILQGCINSLKDSGLVRELQRGRFQRAEVKPKEEPPKKEEAVIAKPKTENKPEPNGTIEILSGIATKLKSLAGELEDAALQIAEDQAGNAESAKKLEQLQALLRGLT